MKQATEQNLQQLDAIISTRSRVNSLMLKAIRQRRLDTFAALKLAYDALNKAYDVERGKLAAKVSFNA